MHRNAPPQQTPNVLSLGHVQPASPAEAATYKDAEDLARRVEAEALGTGLDDAGQPPDTAVKDTAVKPEPAPKVARVSRTHPSVVEVNQARILRRQIQLRDHGNGPQYNPHRDDRRPAAHQADSGNDWHQAR